MGWAVLYIAFGAVALWLLGEVLLQYKARLRWRLLAFAGFATVVVGVAVLSSIPVIALGAVAFAAGQTLVTLSYRRGFSTGWALGGRPGSSRRRRGGPERAPGAADEAPVLRVSGVETYEPQPLPDDTGEYGVYDRSGQSAGRADLPWPVPGEPTPEAGGGQPPAQAPFPPQDPFGGPGAPAAAGSVPPVPQGAPLPPAYAPEQPHTQPVSGGWEEQYPYAPQPDARPAAVPFAAAYHGEGAGGAFDYAPRPPEAPPTQDETQAFIPPAYAPPPPTDSHGGYGSVDYGAESHATGGYGAPYAPGPHPYAPDPYAQPADPRSALYPDTPPGGVWVPQQRDPGPPPEDPPYPGAAEPSGGDGTGRGPDGYDASRGGYFDDEQRGY